VPSTLSVRADAPGFHLVIMCMAHFHLPDDLSSLTSFEVLLAN